MIKVLTKNVADKIAAGEVIDRPLSIVKELVENAIDAGAGAITAEIQKGGKTYIRVTDDGCGIPSAETELAFKRHATSKISAACDLEQIQSLGFRGEALASIAAVSRTELITKTGDEKVGTKLVIAGSEMAQRTATGCPEGTTIVVRDLFYNTPARLKFMKSDRAESSLIIEFVSQIALAYPEIKVRLINNGNLLFSTQGRGDRYTNILTIYDKEQGASLVPVKETSEYLRLEGYISGSGQSKPNRKGQIFFINGRIVNSKVIEKGISEAYADKLFDGRHPIAYLFLHADPDRLDVNIHPNKREVRFNDEPFVIQFITRALRHALATKEAIPEVKKEQLPVKEPPKPVAAEMAPVKSKPEDQVDIKSLLSNIRKQETQKAQGAAVISEEKSDYSAPKPQAAPPAETPRPFDFDELTYTGSIFGTYITATDADCFYLIDQHAAHERVFFERLMNQYRQQEKHSQTILTPIVLNVSYALKEDQQDILKTLTDMGFLILEFGPKAYIVKEIPAFMELEEAEQFLHNYLDSVDENSKPGTTLAIEKIITKSCKSAVKARDYLAMEEILQLIEDLKKCENPFSCPHGRPTFIKMTQYEIEKMFKRV